MRQSELPAHERTLGDRAKIMGSLRSAWARMSAAVKKKVRKTRTYEICPAARTETKNEGFDLSLEELDRLAAQIPSMGGKEIGPFLRAIARNAPMNTAIVEVGSWLGAGTAQLALGVRERGDRQPIPIFTHDRWIASKSEIEKAARKSNLRFRQGEDTLPWVMASLRPFDVPISFVQGDVFEASWNGEPISVYVDDAAKTPKRFFQILRTFGPAWMPGVTVLVLMDYNYWQKTGSEEHKCQKYFIENHPKCFTPVEGFQRGSNAAFVYRKKIDFNNLDPAYLLRQSIE